MKPKDVHRVGWDNPDKWVVGTVGKGKKLHLLEIWDYDDWKRTVSACRGGRLGKEVKGKKFDDVTCEACMKRNIWYSLWRREKEGELK